MCLDYGVGSIIIDNELEIEKLSKFCKKRDKKIKAMLRLNIGIDAHTHEYIRISKHTSKFGESIFDENLINIIKKIVIDRNLDFIGFHCHIGSQIFDTKAFLEAINTMVIETKKISQNLNIEIPEINLGGGFGVYYTDGDVAIDINAFMKTMIKELENKIEEHSLSVKRVSIEPGRSIVGNAGSTLYKIGGYKKTYGGIKYMFIDGGMTDNIRPALYQAKYDGVVANKLNMVEKEVVTVAGKCCESGDLIIKNGVLEKGEVGDLLLVSTTGAYGYSMASNYNKMRRPAVVFVKDGKSSLAIRRESYEDMVKNDLFIQL